MSQTILRVLFSQYCTRVLLRILAPLLVSGLALSLQARADDLPEEYAKRLLDDPGFAQTEFDRIYGIDPASMGYILAAYARSRCSLPKATEVLERYTGGLASQVKLDDGARLLVAGAVVATGYPLSGDFTGLCRKAIEALDMAECVAIPDNDGDFGIRTCF